MVQALAAAAYARVELVEKRGEFAVRGGILDVFPPTEEHPLRIEFWGDTVEEVRWFKVADQRSLEVADHGLWAPPCRELLLTDDVRARARALADQLPGVSEMLSKVAEGIADSVRYLASNAAMTSIAEDVYWPKWSSPWWHMLLLWELGEARRIPERAVTRMIAGLDAFRCKTFPITAEELGDA